jgi:hypothetical protein
MHRVRMQAYLQFVLLLLFSDKPGAGGVGQRQDGEERQQLQVRQVHQDPLQPVRQACRYSRAFPFNKSKLKC